MIEDCVFWYLTCLPNNQLQLHLHLQSTYLTQFDCIHVNILWFSAGYPSSYSVSQISWNPSDHQPTSQSVNLLFISTPFARVSVHLSVQFLVSEIHSTSFYSCVKLRRCHNFLVWALKRKNVFSHRLKCHWNSTHLLVIIILIILIVHPPSQSHYGYTTC